MTYEPIGTFIGPRRPFPDEVEPFREDAPEGSIAEMLGRDGPYVWQADRYLETPT